MKCRPSADRMELGRIWHGFLAALMLASCFTTAAAPPAESSDPTPLTWPAITRQARPWAYWWWMASAVDRTNITRELQRYHDAGMGGVHIIPIYGAKGFEDKFIEYLSPKWMEMLNWTVSEAQRMDLGVDMTTGSGWCFGGPGVTDQEANALVVVKTFEVAAGGKLAEKLNQKAIQALAAFSPEGRYEDLTGKIAEDGTVNWSPENGTWRIYAVSQRPSGVKVKRAGPGGQGHMLNLFYPEAMRHYLSWFDEAFAAYTGPKPRAFYHDSYEYRSDWAPDFFPAFEKRHGYKLQGELPALFPAQSSAVDPDRIARVKCDYRETISDIMAEETLPMWADWSRRHGFLTRNEAHGSPGNLLDLYAAADIPETEMFYKDRSKLVSKFASSAAHVTGKNLTASETGTWLKEHFTETLADMKYLLDDLFLSGINHVLYHGTCYSPDEADWPGWLFYASYEMNPRNSIWRDVGALNAYAARCQSVLQSGRPDNDILLYWPIHDFWHNPAGMVRPMTVHARDWFEEQPIGKMAERLWNRGYAFDYVSDHQLAAAKTVNGQVRMVDAEYRVILVPPTRHMPVETVRRLLDLAEAGATVIFADHLPADVPGWGGLEQRRAEFQRLLTGLGTVDTAGGKPQEIKRGKGQILVGDFEAALTTMGVPRESLFDQAGLYCVRRAFDGGWYYFIANRSEQQSAEGWFPLAHMAGWAVIMDPLTGRTGLAPIRSSKSRGTEIWLTLAPGESLILRCFARRQVIGPDWPFYTPAGPPIELAGAWQIKFLEGGPELPAAFSTGHLGSWTSLGDTNAQRFAGAARYTFSFDAPAQCLPECWLDLGKVCQSARVRLNGQELGTLITPPFRVIARFKPKGNHIEVDVTNVSANRIRDLDRRGVKWRNFYDINVVNLDYKPFDASNWPLADSGLLGPVRLVPVEPARY